MLYQPILSHKNSLRVILDNLGDFPIHKHYEIELLYCIKGSYKIIINNEPYLLNSGEFAFIPCLTAHETIKTNPDSLELLIEAGPLFLENYFDIISSIKPETAVFSKNQNNEIMFNLLDEIVEQKNLIIPNELIIKGNVSKFFGLFIERLSYYKEKEPLKDSVKIKNTKKILDLIHHNYTKPLTVETAAEITGYGKSNFCKIFKNATGQSFHQYLNNYRIERSQFYLKHTDLSVCEIAETVGFNDAKTFCRVFKKCTGLTPKNFSKI